MSLSRANLRALAEVRLRDAEMLLANAAYSSAYYLAGYAVELGLKACVARQFRQNEIPDRKFVNDIFTHKLTDLIGLAGLKAEQKKIEDADARFQTYWGIVGRWSEASRYDIVEAILAQELIQAIGDPEHGILQWIKQHW